MDSVIIQNVLNGSTEDFRYLVRKYKDLAFSVAVSVVKNEFEAEEVVQEAFIKAYRNLSSLKEKSNFKTWLYRILINEAFKRLQKTKRETVMQNSGNIPDDADIPATFKGFNAEEQTVLVAESLKKIPPRECLTLQLFYLEGNTIDEITSCTGWSEANVKVILHRARKHLLMVVKTMMENELTFKLP